MTRIGGWDEWITSDRHECRRSWSPVRTAKEEPLQERDNVLTTLRKPIGWREFDPLNWKPASSPKGTIKLEGKNLQKKEQKGGEAPLADHCFKTKTDEKEIKSEREESSKRNMKWMCLERKLERTEMKTGLTVHTGRPGKKPFIWGRNQRTCLKL